MFVAGFMLISDSFYILNNLHVDYFGFCLFFNTKISISDQCMYLFYHPNAYTDESKFPDLDQKRHCAIKYFLVKLTQLISYTNHSYIMLDILRFQLFELKRKT